MCLTLLINCSLRCYLLRELNSITYSLKPLMLMLQFNYIYCRYSRWMAAHKFVIVLEETGVFEENQSVRLGDSYAETGNCSG